MLQTIKKHRFLPEELVKGDFDRKYKGALPGADWSVMNPLLSLLIYPVGMLMLFNPGMGFILSVFYVFYVSHSLHQIRELCSKILWLHQGRQIDFGETGAICDRYQAFLNGEINP